MHLMNWTDCPIIEQIPGKMSGAPVLRHSRVRPDDIIVNAEMGVDWIADAFGISAADVRTVLAFKQQHWDELPLEFISPARVAALGADGIDWGGCPEVDVNADEPVLRNTPVRPIDLIVQMVEGHSVDDLAAAFDFAPGTVRCVLNYYKQHKRHLAPAV